MYNRYKSLRLWCKINPYHMLKARYYSKKASFDLRGKPLTYSLQDFVTKVLCMPKFKSTYTRYERSGYMSDICPIIILKDPHKPDTLDNLRVVPKKFLCVYKNLWSNPVIIAKYNKRYQKRFLKTVRGNLYTRYWHSANTHPEYKNLYIYKTFANFYKAVITQTNFSTSYTNYKTKYSRSKYPRPYLALNANQSISVVTRKGLSTILP